MVGPTLYIRLNFHSRWNTCSNRFRTQASSRKVFGGKRNWFHAGCWAIVAISVGVETENILIRYFSTRRIPQNRLIIPNDSQSFFSPSWKLFTLQRFLCPAWITQRFISENLFSGSRNGKSTRQRVTFPSIISSLISVAGKGKTWKVRDGSLWFPVVKKILRKITKNLIPDYRIALRSGNLGVMFSGRQNPRVFVPT